jgi:hypothetical protein
MLPDEHPRRREFEALTRAAENIQRSDPNWFPRTMVRARARGGVQNNRPRAPPNRQ